MPPDAHSRPASPSHALLLRLVGSRGIYYGWVVVAVCFLTLFAVLGLRFAFGVFYVAILDDTGWQRGETAGIFSVAMAVYAGCTFFSGVLLDRFGPRRLFPAALVVLAVGLLLCSRISTQWEFYAYYGVLVGASFAMLGFPMHMSVVPRWFVRRRGLASAITLAGVGVGSLLMTVFAQQLILALGWRATFVVFAVAVLLVLLPLNALVHAERPQALGLHPDGQPPPDQGRAAPEPAAGERMAVALRTPAFWLLFIGVSMIGFTGMTMVVHQTRLSMDLGYPLTLSATLFGFTGLARAVGGMFWGPLSDRIGRRTCFLIVWVLGLAGVLLLFGARVTPHVAFLSAFMVLFGAGFIGMTPVYASTVADLFAGRNLGKIMGLLDVGFGTGASVGPWVVGLLYDTYGSYNPLLFLLLGAISLGSLSLAAAAGLRSSPQGAPAADAATSG